MTDPDQPDQDRPIVRSFAWLGLAVLLPLAGAALLWWVPDSRAQTIWVSLGVIVVALAGWHFWRET
ncbi:MAG TPA: hypothetical protein VMM14_06005 [Acidimicrobiia bacterium]|nr:hypothetical protein [Acidimicrobiia bacterium]